MRTRPALAPLVAALTLRLAHAADFDADGFDDLAVGSEKGMISGVASGAVHVLFGSASGTAAAGAATLSLADFDPALLEADSEFGSCIVAGDFDGDGADDLLVAAARKTVKGMANAGLCAEYRGQAGGALLARRLWSQATKSVKDKPEQHERFGSALACGDFDGDGRDDVAIGVSETIAKQPFAGAVQVLYGSPSGLSAKRDQLWHQNVPGIADKAEEEDGFGAGLAAGDLNADGRDDLAILISGENPADPSIENGGAVAILFGGSKGLRAKGDRFFRALELNAAPGSKQQLSGGALAIADFDGDGHAELCVGAPGTSVGGDGAAGAVYVLAGTPNGPEVAGAESWTLDTVGVPGIADFFDDFGSVLETGDFDDDGRPDLAFGIPDDEVSALKCGSALILYASASGLSTTGSVLLWQDASGIQGVAEANDEFGSALASGDFDGDGVFDLAVGAASEAVGAVSGAGVLHVLYGVAVSGLGTSGNQLFDESLLPGEALATGERFGAALGP